MKQGWECPKCGRVYSPKTVECFECNKAPVASKPDYPWYPYIPYRPYRYVPWWEYQPVTITGGTYIGNTDKNYTLSIGGNTCLTS